MTAQQATAAETRRADRWRWLYWLSVALFLSAAAMPYVVAWLWERDLIVRDRPWEYYNLNFAYLLMLVLSSLILGVYNLKKANALYIMICFFSIYFIAWGHIDEIYKEISIIAGIALICISFLVELIDRVILSKIENNLYYMTLIMILIFLVVLVGPVLLSLVKRPIPGWYYLRSFGYLSIYDSLVEYRDKFLSEVDETVKVYIKRKEIPDNFLPKNFLCTVEKLYNKIVMCAKLDLYHINNKCTEQEGGDVKISIYFNKEGYGPYVDIHYRKRRVVYLEFYGWFPNDHLENYENTNTTYCKNGGKKGKEGGRS